MTAIMNYNTEYTKTKNMLDTLLGQFSLQGNWIDFVYILIIIFFIFISSGFIESFFELLGFILSILISFAVYSFFGKLLIYNFSFSHGIANAFGFFVAWFVSESIIYILTLIILSRYFVESRSEPMNKTLRFIPATVHASVLYLFLISLIFSLPVRGTLKAQILESRTGPYFIGVSHAWEQTIKGIFGQAISESLNFMTIKPRSGETVELGFKVPEKKLENDVEAETVMLSLVNKERSQKHLKTLVVDEGLRKVARKYAKQMFINGFFAHVSKVDSSSALERVSGDGIIFNVVGENLAFAPDVYLAHQGLMNSAGHRANILSTDYSNVGIGVIDAGVYGKMFVQVFTD